MYALFKLTDFIHENAIALLTMCTGITVGTFDVFTILKDIATNVHSVELIKNWVSIICTLGGFILMLYNVFIKNKNNSAS